MSRQSGISAGTADNLQVDAGVLTIGITAAGITRGVTTFAVERTIREPEIDGSPGPIKGTRRIVYEVARLTVTGLEWTSALVDAAINGSAGSPAAYVIAAGTHKDVTFVGKRADNQTITITLNNCIAIDPGFSMEDNDEGGVSMTFEAHYSPSTMTTPPYTVAIGA